jgi:hypothetical protein
MSDFLFCSQKKSCLLEQDMDNIKLQLQKYKTENSKLEDELRRANEIYFPIVSDTLFQVLQRLIRRFD